MGFACNFCGAETLAGMRYKFSVNNHMLLSIYMCSDCWEKAEEGGLEITNIRHITITLHGSSCWTLNMKATLYLGKGSRRKAEMVIITTSDKYETLRNILKELSDDITDKIAWVCFDALTNRGLCHKHSLDNLKFGSKGYCTVCLKELKESLKDLDLKVID